MTWKDDAPLMYVCIFVFTAGVALIFCMLAGTKRRGRWKKLLCCFTSDYTAVSDSDTVELVAPKEEDDDPFAIGGDSDDEEGAEVDIDLDLTENPVAATKITDEIEAATV